MAKDLTTGDQLPALAKQIDDLHHRAALTAREAVKKADSAIEMATKCGDLLLEAKRLVGHGNFERWVTENCRVGARQARKYMSLARNWEVISKRNPSSDLTINEAAKLARVLPPMPELSEEFHILGFGPGVMVQVTPLDSTYFYFSVTDESRNPNTVFNSRGLHRDYIAASINEAGGDKCDEWITVPAEPGDELYETVEKAKQWYREEQRKEWALLAEKKRREKA